MGVFSELWVTQLDEDNGQIKNLTEFIEFLQGAYISWESERLPEKEWISKGDRTIFIRKDRNVYSSGFKYPENFNVTPIVSGILRKRKKYELHTSFHSNREFSMFHLVLPKLHIPEDSSFSEVKPRIYKKAIGKSCNDLAFFWSFVSRAPISKSCQRRV